MCSSTCAIASELLKNQGAVRTIAVGGRPQQGPMQGVGGTKGAQVFSWDDIQLRMQATYLYVPSHPLISPPKLTFPTSLGSPEQRAKWDTSDLGRTAFATQLFKRSAYSNGRVAGGINLKDNLRENDASGMPLEFIYEAADCRMFFTAPMVSDVTALWKGVADRMFVDGPVAKPKNGSMPMQMCVQGSMGHPTSISAGGQKRAGDGGITRGPPEMATGGVSGRSAVGGVAWVGVVAAVVAALVV